jgi:hypothetical protein
LMVSVPIIIFSAPIAVMFVQVPLNINCPPTSMLFCKLAYHILDIGCRKRSLDTLLFPVVASRNILSNSRCYQK